MANAHAHEEGHHHYIAPQSLLLKILAWLVALTVLTVLTGTADFGPLNFIHVPLALAIAAVKCTLVVAIFMGLKHDNRVNMLVLSVGAIFVVVFLTFTLFDVAYRGDLDNVESMTIVKMDALAREDSVRAAQYVNLKVAPGDYLVADSSAAPAASAPADTTAEADMAATTDEAAETSN